MNFEIYRGEVLIGHSLLEMGDPPMGVAFGRFVPTHAFAEPSKGSAKAVLSIRVPGGDSIPSAGGVGISGRGGDTEVEILGVPYPLYEKLFPQHVHAYEALFKRKDSAD